MKISLREERTGQYLHSLDSWTKNPRDAFDFHFINRALDHAHASRLKNVEVAFVWADVDDVLVTSLGSVAQRAAAS